MAIVVTYFKNENDPSTLTYIGDIAKVILAGEYNSGKNHFFFYSRILKLFFLDRP